MAGHSDKGATTCTENWHFKQLASITQIESIQTKITLQLKPKLPQKKSCYLLWNWNQSFHQIPIGNTKLQGKSCPSLPLLTSILLFLCNSTGELTWPGHIWETSLETLFICKQYYYGHSPWEGASSPRDQPLHVFACVCVCVDVLRVIGALMTSASA